MHQRLHTRSLQLHRIYFAANERMSGTPLPRRRSGSYADWAELLAVLLVTGDPQPPEAAGGRTLPHTTLPHSILHGHLLQLRHRHDSRAGQPHSDARVHHPECLTGVQLGFVSKHVPASST
jgi:hypothetical protein